MYVVYFLSIICWFGFITDAVHFRGGTITWKPINNNITAGGTVSIMITQTYSWTRSQIGCNSSMVALQSPPIDLVGKPGTGMDLMCNASCSTSGGYVGNEVPITGYCTDFSTALDLTVSQRSDIVNLTVGAYFTATFGTNGGWQALALGSSSGWSLSNVIDLRVRSDNGLINTPPVATCISYISVPVNVQQTIQIPVLDADNDFIRCRFANGSSECLNTCPPGSLPAGTTLSSSCTLTITGSNATDYYLVAIQVEDFMTNTSTTPLSSVPLQFLIYVYATPACTFKPLLLSDINSGDCQGAQVGVNFIMTFTAINQCGGGRTINDIATLSFPVVIKSALVQNTTNTSLWSMTITWMPTADQVGSQVFCAVAADSASVQSDQYCLTLFVGLSSVPLCPGATAASTSLTTQITSIITSSAMTTLITSQKQPETSSEVITTMEITSSSTIQTTSSSTSSTVKPKATINWPLIIGLSLAALALALCCSLCCWYHLLGPGANRRHRKKSKDMEDNLALCQQNTNFHQKLLKPYNGKHHYDRKAMSTNYSRRASAVTVTTITQQEKSFISDQGNAKIKPSTKKAVDPLSPFIPCSTVHKFVTLDNMPQENIAQIPSTPQGPSNLLTVSSSVSMTARTKSVNVTKVPRLPKSSVEPYRSTSPISVKIQPTTNSHSDLNGSGRTRTNQHNLSNVSVRRVKRSSSAGQIRRITTSSSNIKLSRSTIIRTK